MTAEPRAQTPTSLETTRGIRIEVRIAIGFILTIALMLALTGVSLSHMDKADARLKNIVEKNNVKTEMAQIMQRALLERALSMHIIAVLTDAFLKDDEYQRFTVLGAEYTRARETLERLAVSPEEKKVLTRITGLTRVAQPEVEKVIEMGWKDRSPEILNQIRNVAMPKQRLIGEQVAVLIRLQQSLTEAAVKEAEASSANARNVMMLLGGLASVLTGLIAIYVSRRVTGQAKTLEHQALYDGLTNLPNRTLFQDRLAQAIKKSQRVGSSFAIILMDLDRFKEINDTLGHNVGDLLLKEVGERLIRTVRDTDTVARLGGDEYVIILEDMPEQTIERVAEKILKALDRPFMLGEDMIEISASLGIACFPDHGNDATTLTRRADVAMYAAKHDHSGFAIYSEAQEHSSRTGLALRSELRHAIEQDELVLYFQPKIDHQTSLVMGVEALVRWQHPKRGFLPPDLFIPIAEQTGLMGPLSRWVLASAIQQCAALHQAGVGISVAVNLSARNLHDKGLVSEIASLLASVQVDSHCLVIEITESAVMEDPTFALDILNQLDQMGVTLAIDDFGTGYSSLANLSKLPVDEIKIDKSFVLDMLHDKQAAVIVRSTIDLGHNLGLKVVAEGVETQEIWDTLTLWGCDAAQGYFMSKPLPADKLMEWLATSNWAQRKVLKTGQLLSFPGTDALYCPLANGESVYADPVNHCS